MNSFRSIALPLALLALAGCKAETSPTPPDGTPPGRVTDLVASAPTQRGFRLTFTAPGDDGAVGTPAEYDLRLSFSPLNAANATRAPRYALTLTPRAGGLADTLQLDGLFSGVGYHALLRAIDEVGQAGSFSNVVTIQLRDREGIDSPPRELRVISVPGAPAPLWWALDRGADGTLYVAGTLDSTLMRYGAGGAFLPAWPVGAGLRDVAALRDGRVAVLVQQPPYVRVLSAQGALVASWGFPGTEAGQFCAPAGLAVDADNHVYVAERTAASVRLQKFDAAGHVLKSVGGAFDNCGSQLPIRLTLTAWNTLLVFDPITQLLREYDLDLAPLRAFAAPDPLPNTFAVASVTTDAAGYIYLADIGSTVLEVFRADGTIAGASGMSLGLVEGYSDLVSDPTTGTIWAVEAHLFPMQVGRRHASLHELTWLPPGS